MVLARLRQLYRGSMFLWRHPVFRTQPRAAVAPDRSQRVQGGEPAQGAGAGGASVQRPGGKTFLHCCAGRQVPRPLRLGLDHGCKDRGTRGIVLVRPRPQSKGYACPTRPHYGPRGQTFEPPKTPNSCRSIGLSRRAVDALGRHWERQSAEGFPAEGDSMVFTNTVGGASQPVAPTLPLVQASTARGRFAEHHVPHRDTPNVLLLGSAAGHKREDHKIRDGAQLGRVHAFEVRVVHSELR